MGIWRPRNLTLRLMFSAHNPTYLDTRYRRRQLEALPNATSLSSIVQVTGCSCKVGAPSSFGSNSADHQCGQQSQHALFDWCPVHGGWPITTAGVKPLLPLRAGCSRWFPMLVLKAENLPRHLSMQSNSPQRSAVKLTIGSFDFHCCRTLDHLPQHSGDSRVGEWVRPRKTWVEH